MRKHGTYNSPKLDMNPMVDLAFLLVTFFMLTTTFKTEQPVEVVTPSSHSEIKLPETDIMTITVDVDGRIFFDIAGKFSREKLLQRMAGHYGVAFTEHQEHAFSLLSGHGMPMGGLGELLDLEPIARREIDQPGIPCDSAHNELADWVVQARITNPRIRIAIMGDADTPYPVIKRIMDTLLDNNITRFNLITELEKEPA